MGLEQKINYFLNRFPKLKKGLKRCYQRFSYAFSKKIKFDGNIISVTPDDGKEYFFGYYDKSPWNKTEKYMVCLRADNTWSDVSPKQPADIMLIDLTKDISDNNRIRKIAETRAWNVQMGCMLQWLGPNFENKIMYNDFRNNELCSVILDIDNFEEQIIDKPVFAVSSNGNFALTLDFSRLYSLRPGYGYYNLPEKTKGIGLPDEPCIWYVNLLSGENHPILKYADFANFQPREEMTLKGTVHKVNHIMLSPNDERFMVLYRWFNGQRKYTRLITCKVDGTDMYLLSDDDMVSHCFWKNNNEIIAFENKHNSGTGYYLMKDKTQEYKHLWNDYCNDGHPSYSPTGKYVITDTYPNRKRIQEIKLLQEQDEHGKVIAKVFAPFKYDNDTRCDLHPRWDRKEEKICFDATFEGHRGLYIVSLGDKDA